MRYVAQPCYHDHVAFSRSFRHTFRNNEIEVLRNTALWCRKTRVRRDGKEKETDGEWSEIKKKSPSKFRAICSMTLPGYHPGAPRNIRHSFPARLTSLDCSRGEIQIYAPTAPGVFFELMKNESDRAVLPLSPPPLLSPPALRKLIPPFTRQLEAFLNPPYTTLPLRRSIGVYCRSCRRVKTSSGPFQRDTKPNLLCMSYLILDPVVSRSNVTETPVST